MRATLTILLALLLTGCGSFPLGTSFPQKGQTQAQIDQDILVCKDAAAVADNTSGRQAAYFAAGLVPLAGMPIAVSTSRDFQREIFSRCMTARGYRVEQDGRMP